jgi:hypothetical protein
LTKIEKAVQLVGNLMKKDAVLENQILWGEEYNTLWETMEWEERVETRILQLGSIAAFRRAIWKKMTDKERVIYVDGHGDDNGDWKGWIEDSYWDEFIRMWGADRSVLSPVSAQDERREQICLYYRYEGDYEPDQLMAIKMCDGPSQVMGLQAKEEMTLEEQAFWARVNGTPFEGKQRKKPRPSEMPRRVKRHLKDS